MELQNHSSFFQDNILDKERRIMFVYYSEREYIIYNIHEEELLFPAIYFEVILEINGVVSTTPYTMCMSEIG